MVNTVFEYASFPSYSHDNNLNVSQTGVSEWVWSLSHVTTMII